jgi:hypothetical protein
MVPFGNAEKMTDALKEFFDDYESGELFALGKGTENYSWEKLAGKFDTLFRRLID